MILRVHYSLSVVRAVIRLTVYRPLQVRGGPARSAGNYRPKGKIGAAFLKNLSFSFISIQVSDFSSLKIDFAEAHAKGFASL